eukprot:GILK01003787.1.p1 GENE.GILK01003787.1~~GILK01003787.1.p1  ORF type:complete len:816 (-),score=173.29 GILK01003787.1:280-2688(-)
MASKNNIEIFCRVRPTKNGSSYVSMLEDTNRVEFNIPKKEVQGYVNNTREHYEFRFDGLLPMNCSQTDVFDKVAKPVIASVLNGYNGTIFAYGQTGSGKTYTITGGTERYSERGIIPRTLAFIFQEMSRRTDYVYSMTVTYFEIYNDAGYDLLAEESSTRKLQDLPKVGLREDDDGNIHLRNLSYHHCANEEDAIQLLFVGDANRVIAETPMNDASTRSHCIFTVNIEARHAGSDVVRKSKLHLVDLAGSERIAKTGISDKTSVREAKNINLSLHFLEQVIVALHERSQGARNHIPYRNSMMTQVLRDSLGGNCKTTMIATMSAEDPNLDESISTCRFAQRVALIKNEANVNEELDPNQVIRRLKKEIGELKEEIRILKGGIEEDDGPLSEEARGRLKAMIEEYIDNKDPTQPLLLGDMKKIRECFSIFKLMVLDLRSRKGGREEGGSKGSDREALLAELNRYRLLVSQRDTEIAVLISMNQKKKEFATTAYTNPEAQSSFNASVASIAQSAGTQPSISYNRNQPLASSGSFSTISSTSQPQQQQPSAGYGISTNSTVKQFSLDSSLAGKISADAAAERIAAFETFRKSYRKNEIIIANTNELKQKFEQAKALGAVVNSQRDRVGDLKNQIARIRTFNAMQGLTESIQEDRFDPEEERLQLEMNDAKARYKSAYEKLKEVKSEIEQIQALNARANQKLQADFEKWYSKVQTDLTGSSTSASTAADMSSLSSSNHNNVNVNVNSSTNSSNSGYSRSRERGDSYLQSSSATATTSLTGDPTADDNIRAFYQARDAIRRSQQQSH